MMFEWDAGKAAANDAKHGVTFEEAATVFDDPQALEGPDITHSGEEPRHYRLGSTDTGRVVVVVFTVRRAGHAENIRIISARHANRKERAGYVAAKD